MANSEDALKVPGHNNATYGPVPKAEQLFEIELLEIAPSTIPVGQIFFQLLRGEIPSSKRKDLAQLNKLLTTATITITGSAILPDGKHEDAKSYTVPLRTTAFADAAHLSIRDATGAYVDYLSSSGRNDILTDSVIPGMFLRTGTWTFEVVAKLDDGTCLFAISLTQYLEGRLKEQE
ncbi:MAG: hypothetical protein Q9227_008495 [Pyrenula ochraceoflavens]